MTSVDSLMACDIAQLEDLFDASNGNVEILRDLQGELRYRGPQALALLVRIDSALNDPPPISRWAPTRFDGHRVVPDVQT